MNKPVDNSQALLNNAIRFSEVRLIGVEGEQLGIFSSYDAQKQADTAGVDLVCISPAAVPPVCKLMDYNKFRYQQEKKAKEAKKKQVVIDVKEIKLTIKIADHDLEYKVKHAREFLEAKKHVKFRVFLSGREMANPAAGVAMLNRVYEILEDVGERDKEPIFEGRFVNMTLLPRKAKSK